MNTFGVSPKWAEILLISAFVNVGVMVLQQFAQARQSVSDQTSFSSHALIFSSPLGGDVSSFPRKRRNAPFVARALYRKERKLNGFTSLMGRR